MNIHHAGSCAISNRFSLPYDFCATLAWIITTVQFLRSLRYFFIASLVNRLFFNSHFSCTANLDTKSQDIQVTIIAIFINTYSCVYSQTDIRIIACGIWLQLHNLIDHIHLLRHHSDVGGSGGNQMKSWACKGLWSKYSCCCTLYSWVDGSLTTLYVYAYGFIDHIERKKFVVNTSWHTCTNKSLHHCGHKAQLHTVRIHITKAIITLCILSHTFSTITCRAELPSPIANMSVSCLFPRNNLYYDTKSLATLMGD